MGEPLDRRLDSYRLLEAIGSGGMGQVFAAIDERTGERVALKLLAESAEEDPKSVARFLQEGRLLAALRHPGVVKVLDSRKAEDGTPYLVLELIEGTSLREWLTREERVDFATARALGAQIARAMIAVHEVGVVHRDLKPENVMVVRPLAGEGASPRVKVVDFGIAKAPPSPSGAPYTQVLTDAHRPLGTIPYMAPECLSPVAATAKSDVYALGVLLFELITGRLPFEAAEDVQLLAMHANMKPPALRDRIPDAPAALSVLIAAMLAKSPEERPTMRRCCAALEAPFGDAEDECPLPGLQPFTAQQAELFFGRRPEIAEVLGRLERARAGPTRWIQIEGPSGVGKSSLLEAGVLPRLEEERGAEGPRWRIARMRPSQAPLRALAEALADERLPHGDRGVDAVLAALQRGSGAHRAFADFTPPSCSLLLVIEPMEELFTVAADQALALDALLSAALVDPESPLRLLTTVRSDFLHRLEVMPRLAGLLDQASRYHLRPMDEQALEHVIQGMAERAGLDLSSSLAGRMVRDAASAECPLPLLGHALRALFPRAGRAPVDLEQRYEDIGRVGGALAGHAERLLRSLSEAERERAKWILLDLVNVGRGVLDTRRSRTRREVLAASGPGASSERVLERLSGARDAGARDDTGHLRLIVLSSDHGRDLAEQRVDLIHDTLIQQVAILRQWLNDERERLELYAELEGAAHAWEHDARSKDRLPSGDVLERYRRCMVDEDRSAPRARVPSDSVQRFMEAAERRARERRLVGQAVKAVLAAAASALIAITIYARHEARRAEETLRAVIQSTDKVVSEQDWTLSRIPGTVESRRALLLSADASLRSLPAQDRDNPDVRERVVETKHRIGDLELGDGTLARAEALYMEARGELERGPALGHDVEPWRELFGLNHSKLGKVALARGDLGEARRHFERALALLRRAPRRGDDEDRTLATSCLELSELALAQGQMNEAAALGDEAVALFERLEPDAYNRSLLAEALSTRAAVARADGGVTLAEARLARARSIEEQVVQASASANAHSRMALARTYLETGELYRQEKRPEAASYYGHARELSEALHRGDPTRKSYAWVLGESLRGIEALAADQEQRSAASAARRGLAATFTRRDPADVQFQRLAFP